MVEIKKDAQEDKDPKLSGRFARYNSPFLQLMIPLLITRYLWDALEDINPKNLFKKPLPWEKSPGVPNPDFVPWKEPVRAGYIRRNIASLGTGLTILGVIGFYSKRTYDDIKTLYAESVGYELNKDPKDVNLQDMFIRSQNQALKVTSKAFKTRTMARVTAGLAFWAPWHKLRDFDVAPPKYDANLKAGVGVLGLYLSADGFIRKQTFFEAEQILVDKAINHEDNNATEIIQTKDIESLLFLQRKHLDKNYKWPELNSQEGMNETLIAERIADLMNQTYNNTPHKEPANFTIGKLNFLVGFGLLNSHPASMGFIELANRSTNMKEVKEAANAIRQGANPQEVFQSFGIRMHAVGKSLLEAAPLDLPTNFASRVKPASEKRPQIARMHTEFADQVSPLGINL